MRIEIIVIFIFPFISVDVRLGSCKSRMVMMMAAGGR